MSSFVFGQVTIPAAHQFWKSSLSLAFVNLKPIVPGHVLIAPLRNAVRYKDLTPEEITDMWVAAQNVGNVIEREYGGSSITFGMQDGPEAGQSIAHVHIHVMPRKHGDFHRNDDIYTALEQHDKGREAGRSFAVMAEEAAMLRQHFK